jgi:hypothetical protein
MRSEDIIPAVELKGSQADRLKTLDALIGRLQAMRSMLAGEAFPGARPYELHGRYIHAPVWPWFAAGWVLGALFVVLFVVAWSYS